MNKESCRVEKWSSRFCYRGTEGCLLSEDGHEINDLKAERDAALKRVDSRNQSLAKAWTRLSSALARVETLEWLMQWFVARCDSGEIRSKRTYKAFKEALAPTTEAAESEDEKTRRRGDRG